MRLASSVLSLAVLGACSGSPDTVTTVDPGPGEPLADSTFARLHAELSGPAGTFDTDNLISNEASYLHVVGALRALDVRGGAYVGVGPNQNFAYMAAIRPRIAFLVDIRRDNTLQHLLFKALFEAAPSRVEYLSLLVGRRPPEEPGSWHARSVDEVVNRVDQVGPDPDAAARARRVVDSAVTTFGIPLGVRDRETIRRFHDTFIAEGLDLRFRSWGRPPRPYYPTLRRLLLETDLSGRPASHLASRDDYLFLRELQIRNLVIPVVGDLAGDHALPAVGEVVRARGLAVSALYASNVEFYLFRSGTFADFARTVAGLPREERSVLIRSWFPSGGGGHPHAVPGYYSTQSLQTLESFADAVSAGGYRSYGDLARRDALDPAAPLRGSRGSPGVPVVLAIKVLLVAGMGAGLLVLPLGLPGVWIMVALLLATLPVGWIAWPTLAVLVALALGAEVLEFAVVRWMGDRYGGTRASFWGAILGGFVGVLVGMPVPVVGPVLAGCVGTFAGAAAVTLAGSRSVRAASRVGWGVMLARVMAVGLKVAVGVVVLVVGGGALFLE